MRDVQTTTNLLVIAALAALVSIPSCGGDDKHEPRVTPERMPAGLEALVLGVTTEDAVRQMFPTAVREADKSLGGEGIVLRNDRPAALLKVQSKAALRRKLENMQVPEASIAAELARGEGFLPDDSPYDALDFSFVAPASGQPLVLQDIDVAKVRGEGDGLCAWARKTFGDDPESTRCPGSNRRFGKAKGESVDYCAGSADGKRNLFVECNVSQFQGATMEWLSYWLDLFD
jgi:hypothetical protein